MSNPSSIRELIEQGYAKIAQLPEKNSITVGDLDRLDAYTVPLIAHDYGAKTPLMWNSLYEQLGLNIRNVMLVANPDNLDIIADVLRNDKKYLGGGFGVGFKEAGVRHLNRTVPEGLAAVNIVVKEGSQLVGYNTDALGFVSSLEEKMAEAGSRIKGGNVVLLGAGGVAKEVSRLIAAKKPNRIAILNRTYSKAVALANSLNQEYGPVAVAGGEDIIRGYLLNSFTKPSAVINLTDKGSDGQLADYSAFAAADDRGVNENLSRTIARELSKLNPNVVVADITLPKSGRSMTLRIAENEGLTYLLDGKPMVINQAAPAYVYVQNANPETHKRMVTEAEALAVFKEVVQK